VVSASIRAFPLTFRGLPPIEIGFVVLVALDPALGRRFRTGGAAIIRCAHYFSSIFMCSPSFSVRSHASRLRGCSVSAQGVYLFLPSS
jgi:hypothetical protein